MLSKGGRSPASSKEGVYFQRARRGHFSSIHKGSAEGLDWPICKEIGSEKTHLTNITSPLSRSPILTF